LTAPITGPFTKDEFLWDLPFWVNGQQVYKSYLLRRKWYRQAKPYTSPLAFDSITRRGNSLYRSDGPHGSFLGSYTSEWIDSVPDFPEQNGNIYNQAYARFVDEWRSSVEAGVALAEGRQAVSMIAKRLTQMGNFTRHLAKGNIVLAAGDLGIDLAPGPRGKKRKSGLPPRIQDIIDRREAKFSGRETTRSFSSAFLEFHFGWSPLVRDIYDAIKVLDSPFKNKRVRASAVGSWLDPKSIAPHSWEETWWRYSETRKGSYKQRVMLQADCVITNPNLAMAQRFGILNPAAIAWELVPFSFVLDWFVNVGDYLGSLTDFAGVELQNAQRTIFTRWNGSYEKIALAKEPTLDNSTSSTWQAYSVHCFRRLGLGTGPTIRLRTPKPWGIGRGLAAASLLMQRFPRQVIDENAVSLAKKRTSFRTNVFPSFNGKYW